VRFDLSPSNTQNYVWRSTGLVLQGYVLDLEASSEVTALGVGLVFASVDRPAHRGVDDVFGLVADVE